MEVAQSNEHYICTGGCKGVSKIPGNCQSQECAKFKQALSVCDCGDGEHYGFSEHAHEVQVGDKS